MTPIRTTDSQPPPPIRTSTNFSASSQTSSTPMSPGYSAQASPKSYTSRSTQGSPSPTEPSFFGTLASKVRRGRSRSRPRKDVPRHHSKSPLPPDRLPVSSSEPSQTSPPSSPRAQQQSRHFSYASHSSINSSNDHPKQTPDPVRRTTSSSLWRGRHSNSWLFNDFSVTDHVKGLCHIGRNSRS